MKHVIRFNGEELITKSEAIRMLGFSQLGSIDYYIKKKQLDEFEILGINKKLLSKKQIESLKTNKGYAH